MAEEPRKISFQEAIDTCVPFYNNAALEQKFDEFIEAKAAGISAYADDETQEISLDKVISFLRDQEDGLEMILGILHIPEEKFKRIVTLLRKIDGSFKTEWGIDKIKELIQKKDDFAKNIAHIFIDGKNDATLIEYLPKTYRERLNLRSLHKEEAREDIVIRLKDQYIGTYSNWKGDLIEGIIKAKLEKIKSLYGIPYVAGLTPLIDVTVDWAIPNLEDPYVIIMSSYQETTSSGQSTKARDMMACYQKIDLRNIQRGENRAFVNFVDGGGWLARQNDLRRLVDGCHYFLNIKTLDMLESIILRHVPKQYFST